MIVFDLKCAKGHRFEIWFRSSADYEDQKSRSLIACPTCGDTAVTKAITAPRIGAKSNQSTQTLPQSVSPVSATEQSDAEKAALPAGDAAQSLPDPAAFRQMLKAVKDHALKNTEDVGDRFAEEARKIHYGETDARGIRGRSTADETRALLDEGIDILPLPDLPEDAN